MPNLARLAAALGPDAPFPWMPVGPGLSSKPLAFFPDKAGWAVLLKVEPGTRIGRHRHFGEVHGFVLSGRRRLGDGRILCPGDFDYEPAGQIDQWSVEGDAPLVSFFVVRGPVEYLDEFGRVMSRDTASAKAETYRRFCAGNGLVPTALG